MVLLSSAHVSTRQCVLEWTLEWILLVGYMMTQRVLQRLKDISHRAAQTPFSCTAVYSSSVRCPGRSARRWIWMHEPPAQTK